MEKGYRLGGDRVVPLVFKLAVPAMLAQFVSVLYSIVDRIFIAGIPVIGDTALAGIGICGPIVTLLSSFGTLIGIGGSILMAMSLGEGREEKARDVLATGFIALSVLAVVLTVIFYLIKGPLLMLFGATEETFVHADAYMRIYVGGTFFALMSIGLGSFAICQGHPRKAMATVFIGAFLNMALDYVFIVKLKWGVQGAAVATVIAQLSSCLYIVAFLMSKRAPYRIEARRPKGDLLKSMVALGGTPFIILLTDSLIIIAMNAALKHYGGVEAKTYIAAVTIMQSFLLLITGPMIGITGGTQALISYNYGARQAKRIRQVEWTVAGICLAFTTTMFIVSRVWARDFAAIFTVDPVILPLATRGIRVFTLGIIPLALQYTFVDGLTALGCTGTALFLSLTRKGLFLAGVILYPRLWGIDALFYAEPVCDILAATLTVMVFLRAFKGRMTRLETSG